ncbi:MAG: DUF3341 domain-containing protein [Limisphaerales bacterium]
MGGAKTKGLPHEPQAAAPVQGSDPGGTSRIASASNPYGILAEFNTTADILRAAAQVRNAGFKRWDVFTPFPVHGLDKAMGLRSSQVGWFSFLGGAAGYAGGMLMIWYMNAFDYPLVIGGKPMFSPFYSFVPCFELTILLGAFGALLGMLFLNRLPRLYHPLLKHRRFAQVTHDKFYIVIETSDPEFAETETRALLEAFGSKVIEMVED